MIITTVKQSQHKLPHQQEHDGDLLESNHNLAQLYVVDDSVNIPTTMCGL